jgi:hypothetical protein
MADDQNALGFGEEERLLRKILSPAEAQSLVMPPPDHPPVSGPGESTPLTGNLAQPPSQATPSRSGLAGYFAASPATLRKSAQDGAPVGPMDRSGDPQYVKVSSQGQVGYLPKANLPAALRIDRNLKVLDKG